MLHHYAVMDSDGVTIANVAIIDDEAEGWEDERGKWEPFGHDEAKAQGWVRLGSEAEREAQGDAATGHKGWTITPEWTWAPPPDA